MPEQPNSVDPQRTQPSSDGPPQPQSLEIKVEAGRAKFHVRLQLTPAGLMAIGALVSGILASSAAIVWTATSVARRHPLAARLGRR